MEQDFPQPSGLDIAYRLAASAGASTAVSLHDPAHARDVLTGSAITVPPGPVPATAEGSPGLGGVQTTGPLSYEWPTVLTTAPITVELVLRLDQPTNWIKLQQGWVNNGWNLFISSTHYVWAVANNNTQYSVTVPITFQGDWVHVSGTYDGTDVLAVQLTSLETGETVAANVSGVSGAASSPTGNLRIGVDAGGICTHAWIVVTPHVIDSAELTRRAGLIRNAGYGAAA